MSVLFKSKYKGALLGAAIGDAYGWPKEQSSRNINRTKDYMGDEFVSWKRRCGGRYWSYEQSIEAGEYSDDTQLLIATLRSLISGKQWSTYFMKIELPVWLSYERGGGGATKRAARCWSEGHSPWDKVNSDKDIFQYYMAGGNGVAMRILPHVFCNEEDNELIMKQVVLNGMYTHGHPRALIGAMLYASAVQFLLLKKDTLTYGELIRYLFDNTHLWSKMPQISNIANWVLCAESALNRNYLELWDEVINETRELLHIAKEGIDFGVLDIGNETLTKLGCFDRKINGAGTNAAVICIYLFSKYADNPIKGIKEAGNLKEADTDTIASMVGGLLGSLYGEDWIPIEWRIVQDYEMFEILLNTFINGQNVINDDNNKQYPIFGKDKISIMEIGETIEFLPFGKVKLIKKRNEKCYSNNNYAETYILQTDYNQTIYVTKVGKNDTKLNVVNFKNEFNIQLLITIRNELKKVSDIDDFLKIIEEIVNELQRNNMMLSKEFLDEFKIKWSCYKLTKKQISKIGIIVKEGVG